ncbi:MAG: hypothetical protein OEW41_08715 [Actinomycetota bacterium]|nr:hypothetical protein [Actinomycetota bacterium]
MDLTPFTDSIAELTTNIGVVGPAVVGVAVLTMGFSFVVAWTRKAFRAAKSG